MHEALMKMHTMLAVVSCWLIAPASLGGDASTPDQKDGYAHSSHRTQTKAHQHRASKKRQTGKASFYSKKFAGRKTADGTPLNLQSDAAASRTLPLGTKAKVTNLRTGKSAVVEIKDRGPYVKDRIIDVTPQTAKQIDIDKKGVAPVEVVPIEMPQSSKGNEKP